MEARRHGEEIICHGLARMNAIKKGKCWPQMDADKLRHGETLVVIMSLP